VIDDGGLDLMDVERFLCREWYLPDETGPDKWWQLSVELYGAARYAYRVQRIEDANMLYAAGELAASHAVCALTGYKAR